MQRARRCRKKRETKSKKKRKKRKKGKTSRLLKRWMNYFCRSQPIVFKKTRKKEKRNAWPGNDKSVHGIRFFVLFTRQQRIFTEPLRRLRRHKEVLSVPPVWLNQFVKHEHVSLCTSYRSKPKVTRESSMQFFSYFVYLLSSIRGWTSMLSRPNDQITNFMPCIVHFRCVLTAPELSTRDNQRNMY